MLMPKKIKKEISPQPWHTRKFSALLPKRDFTDEGRRQQYQIKGRAYRRAFKPWELCWGDTEGERKMVQVREVFEAS